MAKKTMKRFICSMLALTSLTACATMATACETNNPEVQMVVEFNNKEYKLNYKLYKKITPKTAAHFLALVNEGYYDGMCIHNYDASDNKMYTGGYKVATNASDDDGLVEVDYYAAVEGYENFPTSVWMKKTEVDGKEIGVDPTYTLYGEFSKNQFKVASADGALNQRFGSLTMYYYTVGTTKEVLTAFNNPDKQDELAYKSYQYNSATSLFYMSLSKALPELSDYCTFALLKSDSEEKLEDLQEAINDYIEEKYGDKEYPDTEFVSQETVEIADENKLSVQVEAQTFYVPKQPIVIKSIKQTKY